MNRGAELRFFGPLSTGALSGCGANCALVATLPSNNVPVPTGAPDMSTYVAAATANGVDGVVVGLAGQDALNFVIAARQSNPTLKMALISTDVVKVTKTLGKSAEGIIETTAFFNAKQAKAANKAYDAAMKAAGFKKGSSELSYSAVQVFAAVAKDLPDITSAAVYDKLPTVTGLSTGLLPPIQFQTGGIGGIPRIFNGCEQSTQIKKGKLVPLTPRQNPFTLQACPAS